MNVNNLDINTLKVVIKNNNLNLAGLFLPLLLPWWEATTSTDVDWAYDQICDMIWVLS